MVNRSQHNSWKKQQSKSHSNPSQNSWKQRKSAAPVEPVPKHRSIRCMAEGPTPCRSIFSGWRQKSSKAPVEPMVTKSKHRCNESPLFQRACFDGLQPLFSTGWTDAQKSNHRCNESPLFQRACFDELQLLFSTGWTDGSESKHRCIGCTLFQNACLSWSANLFSTGWTDAPTEHAPVQWRKRGYCVRTPTATSLTQRDRLNRCPYFLYRRFFRWSRFFCRKLPTAMWPPPLYIRVPPGSFQLPLTPWKPEATLEKKRKSFEQKREDLVLSLCFNLEELILCKCSKCA